MTAAPNPSHAARVRTRFAPSPTGFIHLGNIRSALYPWAFARASQGDFILRIEDTDQERSTQAAVDVILEGMQWLGMEPDEGPFYQMQRMDRYKQVLASCRPAAMSIRAS
jgi:glutamyl-tRNA synthetase